MPEGKEVVVHMVVARGGRLDARVLFLASHLISLSPIQIFLYLSILCLSFRLVLLMSALL